jgi:hypothetical protein
MHFVKLNRGVFMPRALMYYACHELAGSYPNGSYFFQRYYQKKIRESKKKSISLLTFVQFLGTIYLTFHKSYILPALHCQHISNAPVIQLSMGLKNTKIF